MSPGVFWMKQHFQNSRLHPCERAHFRCLPFLVKDDAEQLQMNDAKPGKVKANSKVSNWNFSANQWAESKFWARFCWNPLFRGQTKKSCRRSVLGWLELRETLHKRFHEKKSRNLKKKQISRLKYICWKFPEFFCLFGMFERNQNSCGGSPSPKI